MEEMMQASAAGAPDDLRLSVFVSPGRVYQRSKVLLARAHFSGTLELLTAAWETLLGYEAHEFAGKTLGSLVALAAPVYARAVDAILDEANLDPVNLNVRCSDGRVKTLRLHRRFDREERKMYLVADEIPENLDDRALSPS